MRFVKQNICILSPISGWSFFVRSPVGNESALVYMMAWWWTGAKPLSEPMMSQLTDTCMHDQTSKWSDIFIHDANYEVCEGRSLRHHVGGGRHVGGGHHVGDSRHVRGNWHHGDVGGSCRVVCGYGILEKIANQSIGGQMCVFVEVIYLGHLLVTWFNFNPSMHKLSHVKEIVGWNCLSIPKLQR